MGSAGDSTVVSRSDTHWLLGTHVRVAYVEGLKRSSLAEPASGAEGPGTGAAALHVDLSQIQPTTAESTTAGVKCLPLAPPNATRRRCSRLQVYSTTCQSGRDWSPVLCPWGEEK
jgi:hypothetical protein